MKNKNNPAKKLYDIFVDEGIVDRNDLIQWGKIKAKYNWSEEVMYGDNREIDKANVRNKKT